MIVVCFIVEPLSHQILHQTVTELSLLAVIGLGGTLDQTSYIDQTELRLAMLTRLAMKPQYNTQSDLTKPRGRVLISGAPEAPRDSSPSYMNMTPLVLPLFLDCLFVLTNSFAI